jgi:hypothetical protein
MNQLKQINSDNSTAQPLLLLFAFLPKRVKLAFLLPVLALWRLWQKFPLLSLVFVFIFALLLPRFCPSKDTCSKERDQNKGIKRTPKVESKEKAQGKKFKRIHLLINAWV